MGILSKLIKPVKKVVKALPVVKPKDALKPVKATKGLVKKPIQAAKGAIKDVKKEVKKVAQPVKSAKKAVGKVIDKVTHPTPFADIKNGVKLGLRKGVKG